MDESALRCPHCGELADGDTDELLARMRASVTRCRDELSSPQAVIAADEERERATMLSELEQLRGEVHMLRGELEQLRSAQRALVLQAAQASPVVYTQPYEAESRARFRPFYKRIAPPRKKGRSRNRMVIASLSLVLLVLSIVCFFLPWVNGETSFTGFGALTYLFGFSDGAGAAYSVYLSEVVGVHVFSANETVSNLCRAICSNLLLYGTLLYAASLLLGLPLAASVPGRVRIASWHRFFAWLAFASSALLFAMISWASGFAGVSVWFLAGGIADFLRGVLLIFYRGKWEYWGGLHN